ncbi:condensation domain-containing protein, partial [Dactylosporangium siamense]|uniref:condensation domain-containing protein n=1 Tax=Dactylosporangium siamense TaxID=685454 RepID=UPI00361EFC9B
MKVRGFRIEPAEVEHVLRSRPGVDDAVVVADGDRLVAYVVGEAEGLREFVGERLPQYMVPGVFVELSSLPLTRNGKVDRAALPAADAARAGEVFVAPVGPVQELLAGMWAELLGVDRVGATESFFVLGGHSLLATQVVSRIRSVFGVELPVGALFDAPTVAGLAAVLDGAAGSAAPPIVAVDRNEPLPLSFAQQRLWFLHRLDPDSVEYNAPMWFKLPRELDVTAALTALVTRHEVLRTRLVADADGVPWQHIDPAPERFEPPVVELAADELQAWLAADALVPFDLAAHPPFRATLLRLDNGERVLALGMHHVAADEWSAGIVRRELVDGLPRPLPVQYADFAVWQRQWLTGAVLEGQLAYWRTRLAGAPTLELPTDRPRPPVRTAEGAVIGFAIPSEVTEGLRTLAGAVSASMFMTLFSAFSVLLARYTGQDDIVVGTPIANRNRSEVEGLIGFFVNTLALRTDLSGDPTFAELLERVRAETLAAYAHQDLPFESLVDEVGVERDRSRTPLFQVMFSYATQESAGGGVLEEPVPMPVKFDLTVAVVEAGGVLKGEVQFSTALFDAARMSRLVGHFQGLLAAVAGQPGERVSALPVLTVGEVADLVAWNATGVDRVWAGGVPAQIDAQVAATPDAVA